MFSFKDYHFSRPDCTATCKDKLAVPVIYRLLLSVRVIP